MSVDNPTVSTANSAEEQAYREASGQETVDAGTADPGKPTTLFNIVFVTSEVHSDHMWSSGIFYASKYISSCGSTLPSSVPGLLTSLKFCDQANVLIEAVLISSILSQHLLGLLTCKQLRLICSTCAGGALVKDWWAWGCDWLLAPSSSSSRP